MRAAPTCSRPQKATLKKEQAAMAEFLARKYGKDSKLAREAAASTTTTNETEVECLGEKTREERDAEGRAGAVELEE
jgi:hypothetical protein